MLAIWEILTPLLDRLTYLKEPENSHLALPIYPYAKGTFVPYPAMDLLNRL